MKHMKLSENAKASSNLYTLNRRDFLKLAGLGAGAMVIGGCGAPPAERRGASASRSSGAAPTTAYNLNVAPLDFELGGTNISTWGYNSGVPGPEIRLKEGDNLRVKVSNRLPEGTTIHWHGLPIVNEMDGVPDVTQPLIKTGEDFTYEFTVPVSGTYFYHSHVGMQLDHAVYGPLIIEPNSESLSYDQEFTLMLDDWLDGVDGTPEQKLKSLQSGGSAMLAMDGMDMGGGMSGSGGMGNMQGMGGMKGMDHGNGMKGMEGMEGMDSMGEAPRQWPPDVVYPFYLINGKPADSPEELKVKRNQRIRIRLINSSTASIYRVALEGHRMTVTHADGQPVDPVEVDALRIGQGERYDVLVDAANPGVWQLAAQAEGTGKIGRALFRYESNSASMPPADFNPPELERELLLYDMLRAAPGAEASPSGEPDQVVPITLDGDEEEYVWTINGKVFQEAEQIEVERDQHIRFEFMNKSMMPHPMHLHGHFFRVENGTERGPMKDTVLVDPMQRLTIDWLSDNPGQWAFHCHMIYHQESGMMRVVKIA